MEFCQGRQKHEVIVYYQAVTLRSVLINIVKLDIVIFGKFYVNIVEMLFILSLR